MWDATLAFFLAYVKIMSILANEGRNYGLNEQKEKQSRKYARTSAGTSKVKRGSEVDGDGRDWGKRDGRGGEGNKSVESG
jgi:hypothetical protein